MIHTRRLRQELLKLGLHGILHPRRGHLHTRVHEKDAETVSTADAFEEVHLLPEASLKTRFAQNVKAMLYGCAT